MVPFGPELRDLGSQPVDFIGLVGLGGRRAPRRSGEPLGQVGLVDTPVSGRFPDTAQVPVR